MSVGNASRAEDQDALFSSCGDGRCGCGGLGGFGEGFVNGGHCRNKDLLRRMSSNWGLVNEYRTLKNE